MKTQNTEPFFNAHEIRRESVVPPFQVPVWQRACGYWIAGQSEIDWGHAKVIENHSDHFAGVWSVGNTREEALENYHRRKPGARIAAQMEAAK